MKQEPRYWNDDWGIAARPQIQESVGEYMQVGEVAKILKRDVYFLVRLPYKCNLIAKEIRSYTYNRVEEIPLYYHQKWIDLHQENSKLAEHSLLHDEIMLVGELAVGGISIASSDFEHDVATPKQLKYLYYLINDPLVLDVERIRSELFLTEGKSSKKQLSRLIQYFAGIKVPSRNGGWEYKNKGVIEERRKL